MTSRHRKSEGDLYRRLLTQIPDGSKSQSQSDFSDDTGDEKELIPSSGGPQTLIVVCVNSSAHPEALRWLVDKVRGKRGDGGAELIVRQQISFLEKGQDIILHVSASKIKLLEAAEQLELQKKDKEGRLREFTVGRLEDFLVNDNMTVNDILTTSDKQKIVRHELENIRVTNHDNFLPGYHSCSIHEGQSVLQICFEQEIITQIYPLHDKEFLKRLGKEWYLSFMKKQPIEEIRLYFGEAIALYFTFLGFYTTALLIPMFLGFLQLLIGPTEFVPFFCVFNVVWTTIFLEFWKIRSNELAFNWGTIGMTSLDEPRANYHGQMGKDPVSGKIQPRYPRWKTNAKMYLVSLPIVIICMIIAFIIMLASFWCEETVKIQTIDSEYSSQLQQLPSIIYAALVYLINEQYRKLATFLTEWENHRTQSQYDRHRVTKLVLFEFVNNFLSLFYIAYVIQDLEILKNQLAVMLIIQQSINHFQEALLPLGLRMSMQKFCIWKKKIFNNSKSKDKSYSKYKVSTDVDSTPQEMINVPIMPEDDAQCESAAKEQNMEHYEGTYDDYLEMFVQFGYTVLFSSVYPIAAFWGVLNNLVEIRADAFKLCKVYQRPISKRVKDIGAWQRAFEIVGALSIMTNCGMLALSPVMQQRFGFKSLPVDGMERVSDVEGGRAISGEMWVLGFVALEHILLGLRFLIHKAIPDRPEWVRVELARKMYESKTALKNESNLKNRNILTRRFKTVHGPHKTSS